MGIRLAGLTLCTILLAACARGGVVPVGPPPADEPEGRIPISAGVSGGLGVGAGHLRRLTSSRDPDVGPVVGARVGSAFGRTSVWILGDYQAFRMRRPEPASRVGAFYLLGAVQMRFETGRLEVGAGAVQHRIRDADPTSEGRIGWAAGASAIRPLGSGFRAELGWRFGRSSEAETQLLALQISRYWRLF